MQKSDFNKIALLHGRSPGKFAAYLQDIFLKEHLWMAIF